MVEPTMAVTGHRIQKLGPVTKQKVILDAIVEVLLRNKPAVVLSGMATGFDQLVCQACLLVGIPFDACVPFPGQERLWPATAQEDYALLLLQARNVFYGTETDARHLPDHEIRELLLGRNKFMVDRCSSLLACWDGSSGGTAHCYNYALNKHIPIERIDPRLLPISRPTTSTFTLHHTPDSLIPTLRQHGGPDGKLGMTWIIRCVSAETPMEAFNEVYESHNLPPELCPKDGVIGRVGVLPIPSEGGKYLGMVSILSPFIEESSDVATHVGLHISLEAVRRAVLVSKGNILTPKHIIHFLTYHNGLPDNAVKQALLDCLSDIGVSIHLVELNDG